MGINTLITIQDSIQEFVDGHDQLQRVVFCADDHRASYITEDSTFPMLVVCPIDVDVTSGMNVHTLRFYVYERINDDREDVWENANDTSLILRDIRVWWNSYNQDIDIEIVEDPTGLFVSDRELDKLVGYYSDIDFEIPSHGRCDVPVSVTPVPPETCEVASYTVEYADGTLIESGTIASGSSKTITVPNCPVTEDATWTLTDTNGVTLDTGIIPSGGSATIVAPDATININGLLWDTVESGGTENIIVRQSTGSTQVGSKQGQYYRISDSNIQNSDGSYDLDVKAENSLVLPDSQINVNSVDQGNVVSVKTIDVNLSDSSGTVTPDSVTLTGNTLGVVLPDGNPPQAGATLLKTGQTTSYATGDDGDIQAGRDVDFFTLNYTNPFGNTNRFTDELGGATYTNNIVIDWSTYDNVAGTVLGYYRIKQGANVWSDAVANALALSISTFTSGWRLTNFKELLNLYKIGSRAMNYSPINQGAGNNRYWTSTTLTGYTNQPYFGSNAWQGGAVVAANAYEWLGCRNFTVTGTTLT
jgi:hypothetical protein